MNKMGIFLILIFAQLIKQQYLRQFEGLPSQRYSIPIRISNPDTDSVLHYIQNKELLLPHSQKKKTMMYHYVLLINFLSSFCSNFQRLLYHFLFSINFFVNFVIQARQCFFFPFLKTFSLKLAFYKVSGVVLTLQQRCQRAQLEVAQCFFLHFFVRQWRWSVAPIDFMSNQFSANHLNYTSELNEPANHLAKNSEKKHVTKCQQRLHILSRVFNFP